MGSMSLVIKDDKYEQVTNGTTDESGSVKLDATKKPMTIDLMIEEGNDAGKLQLGIIEVTGDAMKVKLNLPDAANASDGVRDGRRVPDGDRHQGEVARACARYFAFAICNLRFAIALVIGDLSIAICRLADCASIEIAQ